MTDHCLSFFFAQLLRELERRQFDGLDTCTRNFCEYVVRQVSQYTVHVYRVRRAVAEGAVSESVHHLKL